MRIRLSSLQIVDANQVFFTPYGQRDIEKESNEYKYKNMGCKVTIIWGESEFEQIEAEFDCKDVDTFEDCEEVPQKFINKLVRDGWIDISTEEKRKAYGIISVDW